jgi:hypothetical protein
MTSYDWLLVFVGAGVIVLCVFDRLVRSLFTLVALWAGTLLSAAVYSDVVFRLKAVTGSNPILSRGLVFDILLVLFVIVSYVLVRVAFPVTKLPKIGILDHLMGLVIGVVVACILVALIVNSMGVMVQERWETNEDGWAKLRASYLGSGLRPYTSQILAGYSWAFVPFFRGLPAVLVPQ